MMDEEVDRLYRATLPLAERMLSEAGEFYPYAFCVRGDGAVEALGAQLDDEQPSSRQLIEYLTQAMRAMAADGRIRAAAICYNVGIKPAGRMSSAICMDIEHRDSVSTRVLIPYSKGMFGRIRYADAGMESREPTIFCRTDE